MLNPKTALDNTRLAAPSAQSLCRDRSRSEHVTARTHGRVEKAKKKVIDSRSTSRFNHDIPAADMKLARFQAIFDEAEKSGDSGLDPVEFKRAYRSTMDHTATDDDIDTLFMKIDANCDGTVEWEEFVTYSLLEYQEKTVMLDMLKEKPFPPDIKEVKSRHHDIIVKIAFFPNVLKRPVGAKQSIDFNHGRYVSLSKDGYLAFWSMDMKLIKGFSIDQYHDRATQPWITEMICMYNMNMIAIASTDRDITLYDLTGNKFSKKYYIAGLDSCITCMDYSIDHKNGNRATMLWGDTAGNIYGIRFDRVFRKGPFGSVGGKQVKYKRISLAEIMRGMYKGVTTNKIIGIHEDWVCRIKYIQELDLFLSCSQSSNTAMYLGDLDCKKTKSVFKVMKGILCFDFCPHHNVIATGGMDYFIRVWNPYVNSKAIVLLKGHSKPITNIFINGIKNQIISIDKGNSLRVYDIRDQTCLQNISGRTIKIGPLPVSSVCFNPTLQTLILGTNQIVVLQRTLVEEELKSRTDIVSHDKPVFFALYNPQFDFVVSTCQNSVVSVWNIKNGEKIIQFANAHKIIENGVEIPIEITAMTFDNNGRRLVTGAKNGTVKVWNFNNGACLKEYVTEHQLEITGIVCTKRRIYVTGWHRSVIVLPDGGEQDEAVEWPVKHKEDVLCMAYLKPNIIATGSYDGFVNVWTRDTGQVYCRFNAHDNTALSTERPVKRTNELAVTNIPEIKSTTEPEVATDGSEHTLSHSKDDMSSESDSARPKNIKKKARAIGFGLLGMLKHLSDKTECDNSSESDVEEAIYQHPLLPALVGKDRAQQECFNSSSDINYTRTEYDTVCKTFEAAVEKIIFLESRDYLHKGNAVLVTCGAEGWIRAWSIHLQGGLLGQFNAAHIVGEGVLSITTDDENRYLITADTSGYVKVWDIVEYCVENKLSVQEKEKHMVQLREKFTYLRVCGEKMSGCGDSKLESAKRPAPSCSDPEKTMRRPLLINSFRAHKRNINCVEYVNGRDLLVTSSNDCSVRLWTVCGKYIGTFGELWDTIPKSINPKNVKPLLPKELKRTGSAQTLKVLNGGLLPHWQKAFRIIRQRGTDRLKAQFTHLQSPESEEELSDDMLVKHDIEKVDKKNNILGNSYKKKVRHKLRPNLPKIVETPGSYMAGCRLWWRCEILGSLLPVWILPGGRVGFGGPIAVFRTLPFAELTPLECLHTPKALDEIRKRRLMLQARECFKPHVKGKGPGATTDAIALYSKLIQKPTITSTMKSTGGDQMHKVINRFAGDPNHPELREVTIYSDFLKSATNKWKKRAFSGASEKKQVKTPGIGPKRKGFKPRG